ncbi:MAG TPA: hypothetical protein VK213_07370 [Bacteroidales bacterium]|nr:hypothetical protein [Bacteroidales bacterium]
MIRVKGNIILIISLSFLSCFSARGADLVSHPVDSINQANSNHSLFLGAGHGDNLILGSSISKAQSYYYGSAGYSFKDEFSLSASSFFLPEYTEFPAFGAVSAGYNHTFNSWFDVAVSLSGYGINKKLTDTLFASFLYGELSAGFDWKIAYTKITFSRVLTGNTTDFLQLRNSRYFQIPDFFRGKIYLSVDPYVNLLFGSMTRITTNDRTSIGVDSPVWTGGGYGNRPGGGKKPGQGNGSGSGSGGEATVSSVFFGLMEADFGIPVGINAGRITIEAEPGYILPLYTDDSFPSPKGFTMMLNCFFRIL